MGDREQRDRLEALEARLGQLEAEAEFLRGALAAKLEVPVDQRGMNRLVEWLGRRSQPVAMTIAVAAAALPLLGASMWPTNEAARLLMLAVGFVWPVFSFVLIIGSYETVRILNQVRAVLRR